MHSILISGYIKNKIKNGSYAKIDKKNLYKWMKMLF